MTKPRRRFGIVGAFVRILVAFGILAAAGFGAASLFASRPEPVSRGSFERSFTVAVVDAAYVDTTPMIRSFGEVTAANTLQLRAQAAGEIKSVSQNLRPGARVTTGEILVQIDPFDYQLALSNAQDDLASAELSLQETREQLDLQQANVKFARDQYDVAQADLGRAQSLVDRGSLTDKELDARKLVVSQREQALRQAESNLALQQTAIDRRNAEIDRAQRAVSQAERTLAATTITAPFDAIVTDASATAGAIAGQNEALATLYEADNLEVRFTLSEKAFGQVAGADLIGRPVTVTWDIAGDPQTLSGTVTRTGAEIDPQLGGVELYARLDDAANSLIRPGTFVSVQLPGTTYENVLVLPETAIYDDNHFYRAVDGQMQRVDATLLARQDGDVIVRAEVGSEDRIITTRLAQAGDGVRIAIEGEEPKFGGRGDGFPAGGPPPGGPPPGGPPPGGPGGG